MGKKGILQAIKKMFEQSEYFWVSLNLPAVDDNLKYFDGILKSINYESIIPDKDNSLDKNLSLLPKACPIHSIIVYEEKGKLKEVITNLTISYKRKENQSIKTHLGESNVLFIDYDQKKTPATDEELEIYKASFSTIMQNNLKNLMKQAQEDYDKIMSGLEEKTKKKRETMRR